MEEKRAEMASLLKEEKEKEEQQLEAARNRQKAISDFDKEVSQILSWCYLSIAVLQLDGIMRKIC